MAMILEIPEEVAKALRLPPEERKQQLRVELALALYACGALSFGKARELAGMNLLRFSLLLGERGIPRQYAEEDWQDDLTYASGE